jgi:hypothetical protein
MSTQPASHPSTPPQATPSEDQSTRILFDALGILRRKYRTYQWLEGGTRVVAAIIGAAFVQLIVDRWLEMERDQRIVLNVFISLFWAVVIYRVLIRRLRAPADDRWLAGLIDRKYAQLHDQMTSAVAFARGEAGDAESNSPELQAAVVQQALISGATVRFDGILNHERVRRRLIDLSSAVVLVALAFALQPTLMQTWFARNWLVRDVDWPRRVTITLRDFDAQRQRVHPRGEPLELVADLAYSGQPPQTATLRWTDAEGHRHRESMTRIGNDRLTVSLGTPVDDLSFDIVGGDARTPVHRVRLVDRPRIVTVTATLEPPAYTNLPPAEEPQATGLEVLAGSRVSLTASTNKPIAQAAFVQDGAAITQCEITNQQALSVTFAPEHSGNYQFQLLDLDGLANARPINVKLRVLPDGAPEIQIQREHLGEQITPQARITVALEAEDQYGLGELRLLSEVTDDSGQAITPPTPLPLRDFKLGVRQFKQTVTLEAAQFALRPDQRLRFQALATDRLPEHPNQSQTNPLEFRVVHPDDFLAGVAQRELELRREFEQVLEAQRGVREALRRMQSSLQSNGLDQQTLSQLRALQRRQGWHASRCLSLGQEFQQLLDELRANRLAEPAEERRLSQRVIEPLEHLGSETYPEVTRTLDQLEHPEPAALDKALLAQDSLIEALNQVLANMLEWEGYREMIQIVEELVQAQENTREATLNRLEADLAEILDLLDDEESLPAVDETDVLPSEG